MNSREEFFSIGIIVATVVMLLAGEFYNSLAFLVAISLSVYIVVNDVRFVNFRKVLDKIF